MSLDFSSVIDMKLAVILWLLGYAIKHLKWKPVKQLSNKLIPVILVIFGIGLSCLFYGDVQFDPILTGIVTSMFTVGIHASGINVWKAFVRNSTAMEMSEDELSGTAGAVSVSDQETSDGYGAIYKENTSFG